MGPGLWHLAMTRTLRDASARIGSICGCKQAYCRDSVVGRSAQRSSRLERETLPLIQTHYVIEVAWRAPSGRGFSAGIG